MHDQDPRLATGYHPTHGGMVADRQRGTDWYSTPKDKRKRKPVEVTLSDEARDGLLWLAEVRGESRSAVVEAEILRAVTREKQKAR